ncbi:Na/Pi cotransporter family protein [[Clostridium] polysaccharolyticum]|uniref:Phosphate:Na+ symporter n=1 Tax=[Clostridium] polysaccharolyticum TaxID=29364 RepID=A0A1I0E1B2_9FIRM|nr:Na/Pi cotransporter family protein [[Clostridium] polysaccharolyticum]SET38628.1 phosphate:Na+ symporter [[Clostridium] polysaccharolyticum]
MEISNVFALLGGLALFIFGMNLMGDGLKQMAGSYLKKILEKLTASRFIAMLVGAGLTALIQSSNAMCVMVVGFVNAGVMQLERSVGVLMGAKIGTTMTGQLIAFNITEIAPVIAFIGVALTMFSKKKKVKCLGQIITSLGVLFIGLGKMSEAMKPLRDVQWFRDILAGLSNPILAVLVGIVFTVIIQSASASVGVLQVMAASGIISFQHAFFVMMGMNIGASVAPAIASIGGRKDAKRVALIVVLFESIGMMLFLILAQFTPIIDLVAGTAHDPSRQLANANTIFNCTTVAVLLPFAAHLAKLSKMIIPGEDEQEQCKLKFINEAGYRSCPVLVEQIDAEVKRMIDLVKINLDRATKTYFADKPFDPDEFNNIEETIDFLNRGITDALIRASAMETTDEEAKHVGNLFHVISDLERIGDHAENLLGYANRFLEESLTVSDEAKRQLDVLVKNVYRIYEEACEHLYHPEQIRYDQIYQLEDQIDNIVEDMKVDNIRRLNESICKSQEGLIFVETLVDLERISDHCLNIAQASRIRYHHTVTRAEALEPIRVVQ